MFRDILVGLSAIVGAVLFSQLPEFIQQYLQRLGGHLDEARGLLASNPGLAPRVAELARAQSGLVESDTLFRPYAFFRHLQPDIAWNTLQVFHPALPLTPEGLIYAAIGMLFGIALLRLLLLPFRRRRLHASQW